MHLVWTLIGHWLPWDTGLRVRMRPRVQSRGMNGWSLAFRGWLCGPGQQGRYFLAGSEAADSVMTQEDCAVGKQARME